MSGSDLHVQQAVAAAGLANVAVGELGGPLGVVGRVLGLGPDEIEAGIPGWAWAAAGVIAGGIAVYLLRDRIETLVDGSDSEE